MATTGKVDIREQAARAKTASMATTSGVTRETTTTDHNAVVPCRYHYIVHAQCAIALSMD